VTVVEPAVALPAAPPPSAYPDPISLPVSPHGDPDAARALASAYRTLADDLDAAQHRVDHVVADLTLRWHGHGSAALRLPADTFSSNTRTLAAGARAAAYHLDEYATALHKAQHHHGWSLTKIIAIGAVVVVTAAVVVVTVGAAAPVGTVAALEVGEAIAGAEAAAGAATAAEASATAGLSLAGQSMTALRGLTAVALPHVTQGAISTGIDVGLHLVTGHSVTRTDLAESFAAGLIGSASTTATRTALHATESYRGANALGQAALDTTALTATLSTDEALAEYAQTGHLNPSQLTRDALLTALTGGAATLRHPVSGVILGVTAGRATGQTLAEIERDGVDLTRHEGAWPFGHTLDKHVGKSVEWLEARLAADPTLSASSSFTDVETAERAIKDAIAKGVAKVALLYSGKTEVMLHERLPYSLGPIALRDGTVRMGTSVAVKLVLVRGKVVVRTAFVE
jgi:Bacterial CdiA-CT RNAse A domain